MVDRLRRRRTGGAGSPGYPERGKLLEPHGVAYDESPVRHDSGRVKRSPWQSATAWLVLFISGAPSRSPSYHLASPHSFGKADVSRSTAWVNSGPARHRRFVLSPTILNTRLEDNSCSPKTRVIFTIAAPIPRAPFRSNFLTIDSALAPSRGEDCTSRMKSSVSRRSFSFLLTLGEWPVFGGRPGPRLTSPVVEPFSGVACTPGVAWLMSWIAVSTSWHVTSTPRIISLIGFSLIREDCKEIESHCKLFWREIADL